MVARLKWWLGSLSAASLAWADECSDRLIRAKQAFEARTFAVAAAEFALAADVCPQRAQVLVSLGQVQILIGKEIEAEASLKSAIQLQPRATEALYALGRLYSQQKRHPEAVALLRKVVEIEPAHHRAWDNLGVNYDAMNQDADALRSFFRALDLVMKQHPSYDWAHANLADFFIRRNEFEKAFQLAAEAAKRNPQSARNCFLTGKALVKMNKQELSLRWLERATELDAGYSEAWYMLSQAYRKQGREAEAAKALEKFRELQKSAEPKR